GYTVARYDPKEEAVFLKKGGQETRIGLVAAKTTESPSTPATGDTPPSTGAAAAAIRSNLRQLASAAQQHRTQHNVSTVSYNELVGADKPIKELKPVAGENYSTLNFGPNVTGVSVTTENGMTVSLELPSANATPSTASAVAAPQPPAAAATAPPAQTPAPPSSVSVRVLTPTGRQPASPSYTIQGGDTWQKISESTGVPVVQLKQLNPAILEGSALPAGQTIRVR
ncbi:MAG: LysM peptidoglycan-binding domain-containing protein, partial [Opitutaceae bacterium]